MSPNRRQLAAKIMNQNPHTHSVSLSINPTVVEREFGRIGTFISLNDHKTRVFCFPTAAARDKFRERYPCATS